MSEYYKSILKIKKLDQMTNEIVTVKQLIQCYEAQLLNSMIDNHQTIFGAINMSKIYFRYLFLYQQQTNKLIVQARKLKEYKTSFLYPCKLDFDSDLFMHLLQYKYAKLSQLTQFMLALYYGTFVPVESSFEAHILEVYFNNGGLNSLALHRAAYLSYFQYNFPYEALHVDLLITLQTILPFAGVKTEVYVHEIEYFVFYYLKSKIFYEKVPENALLYCLQKVYCQNQFSNFILCPKVEREILECRRLYYIYYQLEAVHIQDLKEFLEVLPMGEYYLEKCYKGELPCINCYHVLTDIKNKIFTNYELRSHFCYICGYPEMQQLVYDETHYFWHIGK